ncbi:MAG: hypothetical protein IKI38_05010 [Mogibacterium sp.]|nr:hypothetical protein [Mogibacterium sp.]
MSKNTLHISAEADPRLSAWFRDIGCDVEEFRTSGIVSGPVSCHPDMFMCRMGADIGSELVRCTITGTQPGLVYPHDIAFNAACTGKYFIHNLQFTAPELLTRARELGMQLVNVRQGYAKCSTVVVDEDSVITYDRGLGKACLQAGMNVRMVTPGHVLLPGYDTGFIGGASGRIGDTVYFNGNLSSHPDFAEIVRFIEERGLRTRWFDEWPLTDIGSII